MKRIILHLGLIIPSLNFAQTDQLNLEKYWKFRNSLKEQFVKIGPDKGESLPAGAIKPCDCIDDLDYDVDGTGWGQTCYGEMHWGDGMIRHGQYLGLLATEYRLLKNNGQDLTGILNELYYALNAINRLDFFAEIDQSDFYLDQPLDGNLNGFFLREDIPQLFANNWAEEETLIRGTNSAYYHNKRASAGVPNGVTVFGNTYQNVPSNDQVSSLMVGLSLVHRLVDNIFVQPSSEPSGFEIITETKLITDRIVRYSADHNWQIIDVNGWPVANGGGDMALSSVPLLFASDRIGNPLGSYNLEIQRRASGYNWLQHCITGFGSNDQITQVQACFILPGFPLQYNNYPLLEDGDDAGPTNNQTISEFQTWQNSGDLNTTAIEIIPFWDGIIPDALQVGYAAALPETFPEPFNEMESIHIDNNVNVTSNYGVISGLWDKIQVHLMADITGNRYLELANAIIRQENPSDSRLFYKTYLDEMTNYGPYHLAGVPSSTTLKLDKFHENGWACDFRWADLGGSINGSEIEGIYNAIDYMLFHNLYYLLFEDELPQFKETYKCFCNDEMVITEAEAYDYTSQNVSEFPQVVIQEAVNSLNKKLSFLPNCATNVFNPVNNNVNSVFDINPKFPNYTDLEILTNKFQTEDASIANNGQVNLRTRLIVCNEKTLTIDAGGKMDIYGGELLLNEFTTLDISGEVRLHNNAKIKMSGYNSKIILRNGAKLIMEDNSLLEINGDTDLEFYNGAEILSYGGNSEIFFSGHIKMMTGGTFEIKQLGSDAGKLTIQGHPVFNALEPSEIKLYGKYKGDSFITIKEDSKLQIFSPFLSSSLDIISFSVDKCKVELEENARIIIAQPFFSTDVVFSSITPNKGIIVTDHTRFRRSDFIDVAVTAPLIYENAGIILVYNCLFQKTFNFPDEGLALLNVEGAGYDIYKTIFKGNGANCLLSKNMTYPSSIRECQFFHNNTQLANNEMWGVEDNSNVEIRVYKSNFHHLKIGISKNSGKMSLKCNSFTDISFHNISATNNCLVNLSTLDNAGYNIFGKTNVSSISLKNANFNLKYGRNFFSNLSPYYIYGTLNVACGVGTDCSKDASKNQWSATLAPPLASKFSIKGTDDLYFMVSANQTEALPSCGYYDVQGPPVGLPGAAAFGQNQAAYGQNQGNNNVTLPEVVTHFNPSIRLDLAVKHGLNKMQTIDSLGDDLEAIATFDDIFKNNLSKNNPNIKEYLNKSLDYMKTAHENAIANGVIPSNANSGTFNIHTQKYIDALNYMTDDVIDNQNYVSQYYLDLDKAHLFRVIGHSEISSEILNELEFCGLDLEEQEELNYWKKQYLRDAIISQYGTLLLDTTISIDTSSFIQPAVYTPQNYHFGAKINDLYDILYPNCQFGSGYRMSDNNIEAHEDRFTFYPNPSDNVVHIGLLKELETTQVSVYNVCIYSPEGKIMHSQVWDSERDLEIGINVSHWSQGTYYYEIQNSEIKTARGKFVVLE